MSESGDNGGPSLEDDGKGLSLPTIAVSTAVLSLALIGGVVVLKYNTQALEEVGVDDPLLIKFIKDLLDFYT